MTGKSRRWPVFLVAALVLALTVPALRVGAFTDDYVQALTARDESAGWQRFFKLYSFFDRDEVPALRAKALLPWWSADELSIRFFRPLSSLAVAFDHLLLDGGGLLSHVHGALWYVALIWIAYQLFRATLGPTGAGYATGIYAILGCHSLPLSFLAARHAHVTAFFALGSLLFLARSLSSGSRRELLLHWLLFVVALLSGESAVALVPIGVLYAIASVGVGRALRTIAPMSFTLLGYLGLYVAFDLGAHGSGSYLNPLGDPAGFLAQLPTRWLTLCADLFVGFPADLVLVSPGSPASTIGFVALALASAVIAWIWRSLDADLGRRLAALLLGALLGFLPLSAGIPAGRMVVIGGIASAALLGVLAERAAAAWVSGEGRARAVALTLIVIGATLPHALFRIGTLRGLVRLNNQERSIAALVATECAGSVTLAFGNAQLRALYLAHQLAARDLPLPASIHVLSMSSARHDFESSGRGRFELSIAGDFLAEPWAGVFRDRPLEVGAKVDLRDLEITVLEHGARTRLALNLKTEAPVCWIGPRGVTRGYAPPR